ncbi:sensor histidine kinase [Streptomyces orinoci]|uniref:GAF domain-containing protein n=1 Tax=Streptomyces orinoci TaxID=67339 RepID=A0ABV3K1V8_STRON|nr:GAF domain-containing protein [Streptomyces orinoci]
MAATAQPPDPPLRADSLALATEATRSLQGMSTELTARIPQLLEAMRSVGTGLELHTTLDRIAETAAELADAGYAAIGVLDETGEGLADFITHGSAPGGTEEADRLAELAADPRSRGLSPGRDLLAVPIQVEGEIFGNLYLAGKRDGGEFGVADLHMVRILAAEAGIAIGNARVHQQGLQRMRWIDGSVAVTTALLSGGDAEDALAVVAEQARRLAGADAGIVLLPDGDGGLEMAAVAAGPDDRSRLLGTVLPPDLPVVGQLLAGQPVFTDDAATDPRLRSAPARRFGPAMLLPLKSGDRVLGALATPRRRGTATYTAAERTLAGQFADQAALALVLAEAQRDRERLAVYEDRDRIARDLHDLVIQRLFATGLVLESAQRRAVEAEVRQTVARAVDELDRTIQEIRTAIFALQQEPTELPAGLRTRVLREIGTAAVPLGFQPSAHFIGPVDAKVGERTGKHLIAALREALSNAFRHARASRIEVVVDATARLADGREAVRLTVADDGVGIPAGGRRSGLRNLAKRAESLGGSSSYGPGLGEDGGGTRVVWEAPL